jgi:hypothetical protein
MRGPMGLFNFGRRDKEQPELDLSVLAERREKAWAALGSFRKDHVMSRLMPGLTAVAWPTSVLGKMRVIRREREVLLVTEGLSDPYDPRLHAKPPEFPLDFELSLWIDQGDPSAASDDAVGDGPWPKVLYALADMLVEERTNLRGMLERFGAITCQAPIGHGFGQGFEKDGLVSYLLGMPLVGSDFDRQLFIHKFYQGLPVPYADASLGVFQVKVLRPSELAWSIAQGNEGPMMLAREFIARGDSCSNDVGLAPLH